MVNKVLARLFYKKIWREIKNNFKQFLALVMIAGLAITLFVGLSSSAKSLQKRVDELYELGNVADIYVYVNSDNEEDFNYIKHIDGVENVEKRFSLEQCKVNKDEGILMIQNSTNTINVPSSLEGTRGMVIDYRYASDRNLKIGDIIDIEIPYSYTYFLSMFGFDEDLLVNYTNQYLKEGISVNPLKEIITFNTTITGIMMHPEGAVHELYRPVCMLDKETFNILIKNILYQNFVESSAELFYLYFKDFPFVNQYLVTVNEEKDVDNINEKIFRYFNPASYVEENALIPTKFWGKYEVGDSSYKLEIKGDEIIIDDYTYNFVSNEGCFYTFLRFDGTRSVILSLEENALTLSIGDRNYLLNKKKTIFLATITLENQPSNALLEQDVKQSTQLSYIFPLIFFIVAIFVIMTSLSQVVFRSRYEIGTFKALGIPRKIILFYYLGLGIILTILGCLIGVIAGPLIFPNVLNMKYQLLYNLPQLNIVFPWLEVIGCILLSIIITIIVILAVTYNEIKMRPVDSMKVKSIIHNKKNIYNKKVKSTCGLSLLMALRNIISQKNRLIMVVLGVMGCTALTVAGFGVMDTIDYGVERDLYEYFEADMSVTYQNTLNYELIDSYEEVEKIQEFTTKVLRVQNEEKSDDTYLYMFTKVEGMNTYTFLNDVKDGVAIPTSIAKDFDLKVGDNLSLLYLGRIFTTKVDVIFETSYWLNIYTFAGNIEGMEYKPTGANFMLNEGVDREILKEKIKTETNSGNVLTIVDFQNRADNSLFFIELICNVVKIFAILLAIIVTYNLASLNFVERRRDIATLKVLGFSLREIGLSMIIELIILTIVGIVFGLFAGYPLLYLILSVNRVQMLYYLYHINFSSYLISAIIALFTALIVNAYSAYIAGKVDAVSALKMME